MLPKEKTFDIEVPPYPLRKAWHTGLCSAQASPSITKGKGKHEPNDEIRQILDSFEDEMTCPMYAVFSYASVNRTERLSLRCCDILYVRAVMVNGLMI